MKVVEKDTDRNAEVFLYAQGSIEPLEEYGEWYDAKNNTISCVVPVDEGQRIRIGGRFKGTTMTVQYDAVVDGVLRKSNRLEGKLVKVQSDKIDISKFLFDSDGEMIDTDLIVSPLSPTLFVTEGTPPTIGTIELRISVLRQFDEKYSLVDTPTCLDSHVKNESTDDCAKYAEVPPTMHMEFEKDCSIVDKAKFNKEKKKILAARPGLAPWTTFQFHFRSSESIEDDAMEKTFSGKSSKQKPVSLKIDPVPALRLGSKSSTASKGDASCTPRSSVAPSMPDTSANGHTVESTPTPPSNQATIASIAGSPTHETITIERSIELHDVTEDRADHHSEFKDATLAATSMSLPFVSPSHGDEAGALTTINNSATMKIDASTQDAGEDGTLLISTQQGESSTSHIKEQKQDAVPGIEKVEQNTTQIVQNREDTSDKLPSVPIATMVTENALSVTPKRPSDLNPPAESSKRPKFSATPNQPPLSPVSDTSTTLVSSSSSQQTEIETLRRRKLAAIKRRENFITRRKEIQKEKQEREIIKQLKEEVALEEAAAEEEEQAWKGDMDELEKFRAGEV